MSLELPLVAESDEGDGKLLGRWANADFALAADEERRRRLEACAGCAWRDIHDRCSHPRCEFHGEPVAEATWIASAECPIDRW